jgi:hypothetical protein
MQNKPETQPEEQQHGDASSSLGARSLDETVSVLDHVHAPSRDDSHAASGTVASTAAASRPDSGKPSSLLLRHMSGPAPAHPYDRPCPKAPSADGSHGVFSSEAERATPPPVGTNPDNFHAGFPEPAESSVEPDALSPPAPGMRT